MIEGFFPAGSVFRHLFSLCINPTFSFKLCHSCDFIMFEMKRLLPYGSVCVIKDECTNLLIPLIHCTVHFFYCNKLFAVKHKGSFFHFSGGLQVKMFNQHQ